MERECEQSMDQRCRVCNVILTIENTPLSFFNKRQGDCRICHAKKTRARYKILRNNVIKLLGNHCEICGQEEKYLLNIDHINGGGNQEKKILRGVKLLRHILNLIAAKEKYRLLCYNCNYSKGFHGISGVEIEKLF